MFKSILLRSVCSYTLGETGSGWRIRNPVASVILGAVSLFLISSSQGQQVPLGGLISRQALALDPSTSKVYIVDPTRDSIAILDGQTRSIKKLSVGKGPVAIAVNTANGMVYVANHDSGSVSVVDGHADKVTATIEVGSLPYALAVDISSGAIYVSSVYSQALTIIDEATNMISKVDAGSADAMLINARMHRVYLLGYESSEVTIIDTEHHAKSHVPMGGTHLWGMAFNPLTGRLFVTQIGDAAVIAYDEKSNTTTLTRTGQYPCALAVNSKTNTAYVVNYVDSTVTVIDTEKSVAIATLNTGDHPEAVAIDENANRVYVANTLGNTVTVIDGNKNIVLATLKAGLNPFALVADPKMKMLYIANSSGVPWTRIDISDLSKDTP